MFNHVAIMRLTQLAQHNAVNLGKTLGKTQDEMQALSQEIYDAQIAAAMKWCKENGVDVEEEDTICSGAGATLITVSQIMGVIGVLTAIEGEKATSNMLDSLDAD